MEKKTTKQMFMNLWQVLRYGHTLSRLKEELVGQVKDLGEENESSNS